MGADWGGGAAVPLHSNAGCRVLDSLVVACPPLEFCHLLHSHETCALCLHSIFFGLQCLVGWFDLEHLLDGAL